MKREKGSIMVLVLPLITTLILGLGINIYTSAQNTIQTATGQMAQEDRDIYNTMIKKYIGNSKKGSDVKQMIEDIISQNEQYVSKSGRFISIHVGTIAGYNSDNLEVVTNAANVYENNSSENNQDTIDAARDEYRALKQKINSGKNYSVTEKEKDGIIYAVTITEKDS